MSDAIAKNIAASRQATASALDSIERSQETYETVEGLLRRLEVKKP